jgi:hypothetical protein
MEDDAVGGTTRHVPFTWHLKKDVDGPPDSGISHRTSVTIHDSPLHIASGRRRHQERARGLNMPPKSPVGYPAPYSDSYRA